MNIIFRTRKARYNLLVFIGLVLISAFIALFTPTWSLWWAIFLSTLGILLGCWLIGLMILGALRWADKGK